MKPLIHARNSVRKFGGSPEDYIDIHNWFDQTKAHIPDANHRLVLHNSFGIFLCEQQFGEIIVKADGSLQKMPYITISSGKQISVRDIAEQHVLDDLGCIPTLADCIKSDVIEEKFVGNLARSAIRIERSKVHLVD